MATYVQLESEVWWRQEYEPPALRDFNDSLRAFFGMGRSEIGSKGDNNHMRGRHRSMAWALNSIYCTDRTYGTRDARDKSGDPNALRATDVGITGQTLYAASARLDRAVRAGLLPCVAEWFGTVDGKTVIGWYEGHPSSSDDSHLYHLHVGLWTSYATNAEQLRLLATVITKGSDDMPGLFQIKGAPEVWASDGLRRRHLPNADALTNFRKAFGNLPVTVVATEAALSDAAGPVDTELGGGGASGPLTVTLAGDVKLTGSATPA